MPWASNSSKPSSQASPTAATLAFRLSRRGSRSASAVAGMPNKESRRLGRAHSTEGMSIWSRSRKLSEWSIQTLPRAGSCAATSSCRPIRRAGGARVDARTRSCQAAPTSGSAKPSGAQRPSACNSRHASSCSKPDRAVAAEIQGLRAPKKALTRWWVGGQGLAHLGDEAPRRGVQHLA